MGVTYSRPTTGTGVPSTERFLARPLWACLEPCHVSQNRLPAFALMLGFRPCSAIRMLNEFSRQEHVPFQNIFQSISSGPGYALRRQPGGPEYGGSSHSGRRYRGRRSYELSQCQLIRRCVGLSIAFANSLKYLVFRRSHPPGGMTPAWRVSASNDIKRKRKAEVAGNLVPR